MSQKIFVIQCNEDSVHSLYADLEKAKNELTNIYKNNPNYKLYDYRINVYELIDNVYILMNETYIYQTNFTFTLIT